MDAKELHRVCKASVGRRVRFEGKNGNEYDKANYGKPMKSVGTVKEAHDSHGLCLIIELDNIAKTLVCVDPTSVKLL
jgi:hypothetical protein